jgi:hypothetical protein
MKALLAISFEKKKNKGSQMGHTKKIFKKKTKGLTFFSLEAMV